MHQYLGKRVLVTIGENDAVRQSTVHMVSPNGGYVRFEGYNPSDESIGWVPCASVKVVDVIGAGHETLSAQARACYAKWASGEH